MTPQEFDYIRGMLKERSGLDLSEEKQYLVESRLSPVAKQNEFNSLSELIQALMKPGSDTLRSQATEAMTINESFFFRDKKPFEYLEEFVFPYLLSARKNERKIRIWSAAASTGQETYSTAIVIKEMADMIAGWHYDIVGTDISLAVLEKARAGLYSQFEVQRGLPIQNLVKYFTQVGRMWQIDNSLRAMVQYKPLNLLDNFASLGKFDIVFCRNVLIYFDQQTKKDILARIYRQMPPDGFLLLGAAETTVGLTDDFTPVSGRRGLYQIKGADSSGIDKRITMGIAASKADKSEAAMIRPAGAG